METLTPEIFREVLGHVPTPVAVVTANGGQGPAALAIGSFVSISLEPLLVGFFAAKTSTSWPAIRSIGRFCVNVLADDQTDLSRTFAMRGGNKFAGVEWRSAPSGAPILEGCVVWIDCELVTELEVGDHVLVVGSVKALTQDRDAHALVFHRGAYTSTAAADLIEARG